MMFGIKLTFLYLLIVVTVARKVSVQPCRPAEIGTHHKVHKDFNLTNESDSIVVKYINKYGLEGTIGKCTTNNCTSGLKAYELSIRQRKDRTIRVRIKILSVTHSHDKVRFIWERRKTMMLDKKNCQLRVYDFNSVVTCDPLTLRKNKDQKPEVLLSCHISKVYPTPKSCTFIGVKDGEKHEYKSESLACVYPPKAYCTCNLILPVSQGMVDVVSEVRFHFDIPKLRPSMINATINNTYTKVTVKNCSQSSENSTWVHNPQRRGGYCRNLRLDEQCEETNDCPLCGHGNLESVSKMVITQLNNQRTESCPKEINPMTYTFDIDVGDNEELLSDVDIVGLTLRQLSVEEKEIRTRTNGLYYSFRLSVLPDNGKDVAFRLAAYSSGGVHSLVECHTSLYENCQTVMPSTFSPPSVTATTAITEGPVTTAKTTFTEVQSRQTASPSQTGRTTSDTTATTSTYAGRTVERKMEDKRTSNNKIKAKNARAGDVPGGMETFNIVVTSLPIAAVGIILIISTIFVVRCIRRRRRMRRRSRSRRKPPKSTTKSDEATVVIQNDIYGTSPDSGISCDIATEEETLANDYAEIGDCKDVHASVQKLKNEDGALKAGQYRNEDGLLYTTVDVISCSKKKDEQAIREQPVEYANISFQKKNLS